MFFLVKSKLESFFLKEGIQNASGHAFTRGDKNFFVSQRQIPNLFGFCCFIYRVLYNALAPNSIFPVVIEFQVL